MDKSLCELYNRINLDPWRLDHGFSVDFSLFNERLLGAGADEERSLVLGSWLEKHQPCLFGRVAAKKGLISYCFLTEEDLKASDEEIQNKIQRARTEWTRLGYGGGSSAFILLALSPALSNATPDRDLFEFARKLGSLYLLHDIEPNTIYTDEIFLEMPGARRITWRWPVGVNYFGAAGDGRWWQDHRIPGGAGFSTNSVGHLVKSGQIAGKMNELEALLDVSTDGLIATKVASLPTALEWAMRTINKAHLTESGKATELLPLPSDPAVLPACPIQLPNILTDRNYCEYQGYYHTDQTLPAEYFAAEVARPVETPAHRLDFTYLFHDEVSNPDYLTTGAGRRVRGLEEVTADTGKVLRAVGETGRISSFPRLIQALGQSTDQP